MALRLSHRVHFNSYHVHLDVSFSTVVESGALLSSNLEGRFRNSLFIMNESTVRGIYFISLYVFILIEGKFKALVFQRQYYYIDYFSFRRSFVILEFHFSRLIIEPRVTKPGDRT